MVTPGVGHMMFHCYFESNSTKQYSTKFFKAKDPFLSSFLFMIVAPFCKYSKNNVYIDSFYFNLYTFL